MNNTKFPIIEQARGWFHRQPSAKQKQLKKYGTIGAFSLIALGVYYLTGQSEKKPRVPEVSKDVSTQKDDSVIQDDIVTTLNDKIKTQGETIDDKVKTAVQDAIKNGYLKPLDPSQTGQGLTPTTDSSSLSATASNSGTGGYPSAPEYPGMSNFPQPTGNGSPAAAPTEPPAPVETVWVGGISEGNGDIPLTTPEQDSTAKKNQIQLPVGFMKAKLLVGVNALTGEFGSENPQTLMFRVQAPAQLPNFIKMNLRGCFAIANANGNLSSERIIVLPVSMNCMTMDGRYIVEGQVKGFVSDRDGKRDMSARVVSRAGRLLAGTVLAKSVEAFANVIGNQSIQQNVSPLGSVNTINPDEAVKNGAATGVAGGFTEVSKYLLNLAQQTSPALETGPGKDVMLFIQETAELTIKEVRIQ
ncbi:MULTISPECIES: TraB/VirB10 family protein [Enterobacteriaceae]|uniref:Conjugal transfer protein TraB n=1 Tax=Citrobacter freundii TaxID=546 RepID=A0AAP9TZX9_CITFR|nr:MULTISPECIES: TraB/VirB10 family protein [Enterobacteriaceae]MDF6026517.1 TraB/VirB10 family protein [Escherichia coli]MDT7358056.1 TraB/VirB10 family protein [Citrobacter freundii]MEA8884798.1 TraB/VirB10 family protein [Citrobacter freundii]QLV33628.1 conjugal transfer protein TraB [Citrobacter freundii]HAW7121025.1 conjugal transfer protein TraB [Citrobacter freundii]